MPSDNWRSCSYICQLYTCTCTSYYVTNRKTQERLCNALLTLTLIGRVKDYCSQVVCLSVCLSVCLMPYLQQIYENWNFK